MPTPLNRYAGLLDDWNAGHSVASLAEKYGITVTSVARIAKERGGEPRKPHIKPRPSTPAWVPVEWRPSYFRLPPDFRATLDAEYGPPANAPEEIKAAWATYSEDERTALRGTYASA